MSQLLTLLWLKWALFRNSLRSSKAIVNRIASLLGIVVALVLALSIAFGLGIGAYALTSPEVGFQKAFEAQRAHGEASMPSAEFIFFSIFALVYLIWSTVPLSIGSNRTFDPGNLLLYPISLRKLFAIDFISEVAGLQAIFAIPAIIFVGIGAGLGSGHLVAGILLSLTAVFFGIALSKWISTSVGSLLRRKRTRGETLLALVGAVAGLGGALFGQIAPVIFRHAETITYLRWTPPGAIAYALAFGLKGNWFGYALALLAMVAYSFLLVFVTYRLAQRALTGSGRKRREPAKTAPQTNESYTGWELPLLSPALSAVVEKELRYLMRNAQIRMMTMTPLILIVVRFMNRRRFGSAGPAAHGFGHGFFHYGEGLMVTTGLLYVFLILSGLFCNQFAFEKGGMRALVLSPVSRKTFLLGKNIAISIVALIFGAGLLIINELVFRDLTPNALLFAVLSFFTFLSLMLVMGNSFSLRFPKRLKFGKRLNLSGVVGLLLIPALIVLALPPLAATAAGYVAQSLLVEYATLGVLAALTFGLYLLLVGHQGETLQRRELEILEAVNDPGNNSD
ncbi:MAG TPA: hypothetical protein VLL54_01830 [Pyrinomonadaceae bacterium]|nr:hypothetical protein [Pyrinomonadaceae bacterium]